MALISYYKAEPTEYILAYANGRITHEGSGRAFWYWTPSTSVVSIPTSTIDALFMLNESTGTFQPISLQGQITYRIIAPRTIAELLNFTIDPVSRQYQTEDPAKLSQRIINVVQAQARDELRQFSLEDALRAADQLSQALLRRMRAEQSLADLGVECMSLVITAIKTTPEMAKALEAEYRETLQRRADQAIYGRRAEAVEQERKIKQNELSTSVDLEQRRSELVELQGVNIRNQAEFEAEALKIQLATYQNMDARMLLALAFRDFANNAQKIGNLTITADILEQLINRE